MLTHKSVLISNHNLEKYAGSELNTFEISSYFKNSGYSVTVCTFNYGDPIKQLFDHHNIQVIDLLALDNSSLTNKEFDIIWAQDAPTLDFLLFSIGVKYKRILFSSLSSFEPLAAPPLYINNLNICLANSKETRDQLLIDGVEKDKIFVFNNSVTDTYLSSYKQDIPVKLEKIAIVSNHIPTEIEEAKRLLEEKGISVVVYGLHHNECLVQPEHLLAVDAVITIGKTVQYALALGLPVYCYDHFGGPGWITKHNYLKAEYFNYSGRCSNRRISETELSLELTRDYPGNSDSRLFLHNHAKASFNLEANIKKALSLAENNAITLTPDHKTITRHNQYYTRLFKNYLAVYKEHNSLQQNKNRFFKEFDRVSKALLNGDNTHSDIDLIQFMLDRVWSVKVQKEEVENHLKDYQSITQDNEAALALLFNTKLEEQKEKEKKLLKELSLISKKLEENEIKLNTITTSKSWKLLNKVSKAKNKLYSLLSK